MLSSMTPTFLESPGKVAVLGTPGGSRIITMVLLGILGFDDGLDARQVVALPRYHHQWLPDVIQMESDAISPDAIRALQAMGHRLQVAGNTAPGGIGSSHVWGNMNAVEWNRRAGTLQAASDPRNPVGEGKVVLAH
jgi:gamma-glutamyltranspeptidase/glutathione hydrolase